MVLAAGENEQVKRLPVSKRLVAILDDGIHGGRDADDDEEAESG